MSMYINTYVYVYICRCLWKQKHTKKGRFENLKSLEKLRKATRIKWWFIYHGTNQKIALNKSQTSSLQLKIPVHRSSQWKNATSFDTTINTSSCDTTAATGTGYVHITDVGDGLKKEESVYLEVQISKTTRIKHCILGVDEVDGHP